jgi:hypothetical protein
MSARPGPGSCPSACAGDTAMAARPKSGREDGRAEQRGRTPLAVATYYLPLVLIILVADLLKSGRLPVGGSPVVRWAAAIGVSTALYMLWTATLRRLLPDVWRRPPGRRLVLTLFGLGVLAAGMVLGAVLLWGAVEDRVLGTDWVAALLHRDGERWTALTVALVVVISASLLLLARRGAPGRPPAGVLWAWAGANAFLTALALAVLRLSTWRSSVPAEGTGLAVEPATFVVGLGALCFSVLSWVLLWRTARRSKA